MSEHSAGNDAPEFMVWHDEADRLAVWGTLDPPDACMCRECVIPPGQEACPRRYSGNGHLGNPCVYCGHARPLPPAEGQA